MKYELPVVMYCFENHVDDSQDHYGNAMDFMKRNRDDIGMYVFANAHLKPKPTGAYDPSEPNTSVYDDLGSCPIIRVSDIRPMAEDFMKRGAYCWAALFYTVLADFHRGKPHPEINESDQVVLMAYTTSVEDVEVLGY